MWRVQGNEEPYKLISCTTKYIIQRDNDIILSRYKEESFRKEFTDELHNCVAMGKTLKVNTTTNSTKGTFMPIQLYYAD